MLTADEAEAIREERAALSQAMDQTIYRLRTAGRAFKDAMVQSGALNSVPQDQYIRQLRDFEIALNGYVGGDGKWHRQD